VLHISVSLTAVCVISCFFRSGLIYLLWLRQHSVLAATKTKIGNLIVLGLVASFDQSLLILVVVDFIVVFLVFDKLFYFYFD
jgi:hypothetical protein